MSICGEGGLSATTKAERLSSEIYLIARGQAFHFAKTSNGLRVRNGERDYGMPGSETVVGKSTVMLEVGLAIITEQGSSRCSSEEPYAGNPHVWFFEG